MREYHRKLCSSGSLFPFVAGKRGEVGGPSLSAVLLLNSPSRADDDLEEYLRLWTLYRRATPPPSSCRPCYFLCGDGAFRRLRLYVNGKAAAKTGGEDWMASSALCDAVIGDMDSLSLGLAYRNRPSSAQTPANRTAKDRDAAALLPYLVFHGDLYDTVEDIPVSLLEEIHLRMRGEGRRGQERREKGEEEDRRVPVLPIACQLTTDCHKCVALVQRLRSLFPNDFAESVWCSVQPMVLLQQQQQQQQRWLPLLRRGLGTGGGELPLPPFVSSAEAITGDVVRKLAAVVEEEGREESMRNDAERELTLLLETSLSFGRAVQQQECCAHRRPPEEQEDGEERGEDRKCREWEAMASSSSAEEEFRMITHVLPNVAVFGALGGRMDHELASISSLLAYATELHLMLVNTDNVLFACWPDGITTWLPMAAPAPSTPTPSEVKGEEEEEAVAVGVVGVGGSTGERRERGEGATCGLIPFGPVVEMETAGLLYDMVKGRSASCAAFAEGKRPRYDGVTQTERLSFAFGQILSTSNTVDAPVITVDMRPLSATAATQREGCNPPTVLTCNRA